MNREIKNGIIKEASLSNDDHGVLTSYIRLEYECGGQCFGGYTLHLPISSKHYEIKSVTGHWIWRVMDVAGVNNWSDLIGKPVRVDAEHSKCHGIGHFLKDDWFYPAEDFKDIK